MIVPSYVVEVGAELFPHPEHQTDAIYSDPLKPTLVLKGGSYPAASYADDCDGLYHYTPVGGGVRRNVAVPGKNGNPSSNSTFVTVKSSPELIS